MKGFAMATINVNKINKNAVKEKRDAFGNSALVEYKVTFISTAFWLSLDLDCLP
jgi:hypothetical protein